MIQLGEMVETTNLPFQIRGRVEKVEGHHIFVRTRKDVMAHLNLKFHEIRKLEE